MGWGEGLFFIHYKKEFLPHPRFYVKHIKRTDIEELTELSLCSDAQSCPTPCNPMDCDPQGSRKNTGVDGHFLLQMPLPSSSPRDQTCDSSVSCIGRRVLHH